MFELAGKLPFLTLRRASFALWLPYEKIAVKKQNNVVKKAYMKKCLVKYVV